MLSWRKLKCYVDLKGSYRKLSRTILSNMWIGIDDRGSHDLIWGDIWKGTDEKNAVMTKINVLCGFERKLQEAFTNNLK
jgi:hypothetical protein